MPSALSCRVERVLHDWPVFIPLTESELKRLLTDCPSGFDERTAFQKNPLQTSVLTVYIIILYDFNIYEERVMERISVTQAVRQFSDLLNRIFYQGVSVELERGNKVIARISPVSIASSLKVKDLNRMFAELPSLGDDAGVFAKDLEDIRKQIPLEKTQWD
jgi:antitoxin (DNA-binding transcriptional repressor) of toxin-antitoxin stability system